MTRCYAITGVFVPTNEPMSLLSYKYLRSLDINCDVVALKSDNDISLSNKLQNDPLYKNFNVKYFGNYNDALFSIKNVNLIKALHNVNRYVDNAVNNFDNNKYDLLYTSSFPAYTIRAGKKIKDKYPNIPWIASFTDPINNSPYKNDQRTYKEYILPEKMAYKAYCKYYVDDNDEITAFNYADLLVFICEEQRDFMINQYLKKASLLTKEDLLNKSVIFPLNYVKEWNDIVKMDNNEKNDMFTFAHFGRVYGLRNATNFIYAIDQLRKESDKQFVVKQYGEFRKSDIALIKKLGLNNYFDINKKIPYEKCIEEMNKADILLVFDTIMPDDEIQPYLPSKLLEYSLLEKNTLTITCKYSPSYRIASNSNALVCFDNIESIKECLKLSFNTDKSIIDYKYENKEASIEFVKKTNELLRMKK